MVRDVSSPGRDTAPRGIVARVTSRLLAGYSVPDMCTATDCERDHELAICSLCSHMVCHRNLPTLKQTPQNNSSSVECSGPWGPEGPQDMQGGPPTGASCVCSHIPGVGAHVALQRHLVALACAPTQERCLQQCRLPIYIYVYTYIYTDICK